LTTRKFGFIIKDKNGGFKMKCDGSCSKHSEKVVPVIVYGHGAPRDEPWSFNYCEVAISEDRKNNWIVEEVVK
jgi:hypothetical protein